MKAKTLATITFTLLAVSIVLATIFTPAVAKKEAKLKFKPGAWVYSSPLPSPYWNASIYKIDPSQVNPTTVSLTGETVGRTIYPVAYDVRFLGRDEFRACFNPIDMRGLVTDILIHEGVYGVPGNYPIYLVISGEFYDATYFQATRWLNITVP